jgi:hypothetical protein
MQSGRAYVSFNTEDVAASTQNQDFTGIILKGSPITALVNPIKMTLDGIGISSTTYTQTGRPQSESALGPATPWHLVC